MRAREARCSDKLAQAGFSLIELVIAIVVLGILAAVAIPKYADMTRTSKITATQDELNRLRQAIVGNPSAVAGGQYVDRGFEGDIGFPPTRLQDLAAKPSSLAVYNNITRFGWNGPYIDSSGGTYLKDAWGISYIYDPANRRIKSIGGGSDSVVVTF